MRNFFEEPIVRFLSIGLILYLTWLAVYEWWIHPMKWVDLAVINNTISISRGILGWMGYNTYYDGSRMMGVEGTPGLFIGDNCNGISLFALYGIFIISFPGKIISKLVFIPAGLFVIHLLNVLRVTLLAIIEIHSYKWTEFNHTYTFTILIYSFIFLTWLFWINKFSALKRKTVS